MDRTQNKVEKSRGRGRSVQERAKNWEAINKVADDEVQKGGEDKEETDEEMDVEETATPVVSSTEQIAPAAVPLPVDDDEEIL